METNNDIKAEAARRLMLEEAKAREEEEAKCSKLQKECEEAESRIKEERERLLAEDEQVRITARRLMIEAEAKRIADEKEAAIAAEIERLRKRTKVEILEDKISELICAMNSIKEKRDQEVQEWKSRVEYLSAKLEKVEDSYSVTQEEKNSSSKLLLERINLLEKFVVDTYSEINGHYVNMTPGLLSQSHIQLSTNPLMEYTQKKDNLEERLKKLSHPTLGPKRGRDKFNTLVALRNLSTEMSQSQVQGENSYRSYNTFRFRVLKTRSSTTHCQISGIHFGLKNGGDVMLPSILHSLSSQAPVAQQCESVMNIIYNYANRKWCTNTPSPEFILSLNGSIIIDRFSFTTASDLPERDPSQWILEGSNDRGDKWVVLHQQTTDFSASAQRNQRQQWFNF